MTAPSNRRLVMFLEVDDAGIVRFPPLVGCAASPDVENVSSVSRGRAPAARKAKDGSNAFDRGVTRKLRTR